MSFLLNLKKRVEEVKDFTKLADNDLISIRINTCNECEHLFKPTRNCKKCGCFVDGKVRLQNQQCPLNKW